MTVLSLTRLRLRKRRLLLPFFFHALRSTRQVKGSEGFIGGYLASGPRLAFWTVTLWRDEEAMRAYRRTGSHLKAMPKLMEWCDEAAVATLHGDFTGLLEPAEIAQRLADEGRLSKVRRPSAQHLAGEPWPDRAVPRRVQEMAPRGTQPSEAD